MDKQDRDKALALAAKQSWRKVLVIGNHSDVTKAHALRRHLVNAGVFPPNDDTEAGNGFHEVVIRAALPDILGELDYIDLLAVYRTARLLAIVERDPAVFAYSAFNTACVLHTAGTGPDPEPASTLKAALEALAGPDGMVDRLTAALEAEAEPVALDLGPVMAEVAAELPA